MSFILKDKIKLPTTDALAADLKRLKVTNNKDNLYNSFFDEAKYHIFIYKINAENTVLSIDSVNIITPYRTGYQNLINYSYINNDSIILALNPFYNNLTLHDTSIIIVDTKGKLNGVASFKGTIVPTRNAVLTDGYDGFLGSDDTTNKYYNFLSFYGASCMVFNQQKKLLVGFAPRHTIKKTCERVNIQTQYNASFLSFDTTSPAENLYNIRFPCEALQNLYYPITIEWPHMVYNSSN